MRRCVWFCGFLFAGIRLYTRWRISDWSSDVCSSYLTGDNTATAQTIARQAGIDDARGNLLPEDKLVAIEDMQKRYGLTGMTGDGINDAPALDRKSTRLNSSH